MEMPKLNMRISSFHRALITFLCSIVLLFFYTHVAMAESRSTDELRNSVVRILCYGSDGGLYTGTGFAVGNSEPVRHIVTNYHVVEPNLNGVNILLSKEDQIEATVIAYDKIKDLAILELSQDLFKRPPMELGNSDEVKASQEVYALGFPGDADLIDDTPSGEPNDVTITKGIISKISTQGGRGILQIDVNINPGNSGGPLVNVNGQVIGVNTFGVTSASGINGAVQIEELIPMLESRGINYLTAANPIVEVMVDDPAEKSTAIWWIIGIAAAGLFSLIIIIVVIILITRKKGNKPGNAAPSAPITPSNPTSVPKLKGLSGYFVGQTLELNGTQLSIGRDAKQCQLVYPHTSEEISRKHCTVRFDHYNQTFMIEDHSSNGTFLVSGERIPQGKITQLRSGDRFYLSSNENMFEVSWEIK